VLPIHPVGPFNRPSPAVGQFFKHAVMRQNAENDRYLVTVVAGREARIFRNLLQTTAMKLL
jgi:hypothetical protein